MDRIEALDDEIAELDRISRAPMDAVWARMRRDAMEQREEKRTAYDQAVAIDPEYPAKLAAARQALTEAEAAANARRAIRIANARASDRLDDAWDPALHRSALVGDVINVKSVMRGGVFLPAKAAEDLMADLRLDQAKNRVKRLEQWPKDLALDRARALAATEGEAARRRRFAKRGWPEPTDRTKEKMARARDR